MLQAKRAPEDVAELQRLAGAEKYALRRDHYEWVYMYAAVEPDTGESAAMFAPYVNTGMTNAFLEILDAKRKPDKHLCGLRTKRFGTRVKN
jgi:hypothetical protein